MGERRGICVIWRFSSHLLAFFVLRQWSQPPSTPSFFWVSWLLGGIIGFLGRLTARRFYAASSMGARLDTWVSLTCVVAMVAVMAGNGDLPGWLWCCLFFAGALRVFCLCDLFPPTSFFRSASCLYERGSGTAPVSVPVLFGSFRDIWSGGFGMRFGLFIVH